MRSMNIQSISVVVPTKGCVNKCKFCVSRMHESSYENKFDEIQIRKRIKFAANNRVNTLIITGVGEPLQNLTFLRNLREVLDKEHHPFPNVELQTTGVMLMHMVEWDRPNNEKFITYFNVEFLKKLGVNTISLSISNIFNSEKNNEIIGIPEKLKFKIKDICKFIKDQGFNLRLSLNMTKIYSGAPPLSILEACKNLRADQITFRKLWYSDNNSSQTKWVKENSCSSSTLDAINTYITGYENGDGHGNTWQELGNGKPLYRLPFGPMAYSINGMSVVIDDNCMSKDDVDNLKYVILRENGKLYCQWDDEGSLIF